MRKLIIILVNLILVNYSVPLLAGVPQLNLDCKSLSEHMVISGYPRGEGYDLKIKINDHVLRYVDKCSDIYCSKREKYGDLYIVEALNKKVFTIYFVEPTENGELFMGYFYALPETVKYTKTTHGYRAQYIALYDGADPRSNTSPRAFVGNPIKLTCIHQEEL
ncbi:hypothetical protein [Legionella sp. PC997]|uniref:hypothetical protein n=1 Tax=Legionella sp. PC997 TaxID=2755562 RepID=UPI0015F84AB6|nr:hypothetical protein [Legionella sp. PC997]QMT59170.1 hypothetical protein HBNCFIEN_00531 [Legionella sp. PC997]